MILLRLYECRPPRRGSSSTAVMAGRGPEYIWLWALLVGASFALWRSVFLVEAGRERRGWEPIQDEAEYFLRELVETNAINFPQDRNASRWSSGYYIYSAYYRIEDAVRRLAEAEPHGLDLRAVAAIRKFTECKKEFHKVSKLELWDTATRQYGSCSRGARLALAPSGGARIGEG